MRDLIRECQLLLIDWVTGFNKTNYVIERWSLYNEPGGGLHDLDPDEDIPFDPEL
ncbi:hypothetical protein [Saccharicrinis carchari]|uniref:hypothetical protein n=1 Tax=Saccharicrinis carchari TaxID=1168039 RepID=UPI00163D5629|nr:hypothetical protein [Saccharicrinis carchari]